MQASIVYLGPYVQYHLWLASRFVGLGDILHTLTRSQYWKGRLELAFTTMKMGEKKAIEESDVRH